MKQISQNIRRLRKEKGMSQEQLAQALHVTRQTVSAWERGIAQPGLDVLGQIAQLLGVEPERLLYGEDSGRGRFYRVFLAGIGRDPHVLCYGILGSAHPHKPGSRHFY